MRLLGKFKALSLRNSERGVAIVEFAFAAPLLFMVLFGVVDISGAMGTQTSLYNIAFQGMQEASGNALLETANVSGQGEYGTLRTGTECGTGSTTTQDYHSSLQAKIRSRIEIQNLEIDLSTLCITTTKNGSNVSIRIIAETTGFFDIFPLDVTASGTSSA